MNAETTGVVGVFVVVYAGMLLGGLPRLRLDRTGVALLGAIAIVGGGALTIDQAASAIHLPTVLLLFSFMVLSAQMRLGGFYGAVTRGLVARPLSPPALLAGLIAVAGGLSAVFSNDVVCLAVAPVLVRACHGRRLDPVPFLLALACAANIGSAATLIGNPQNMLVGEVLRLPFGTYLREALVPVLLGLVALWLLLRRDLPSALPAAPGAALAAAGPGDGARATPGTHPKDAIEAAVESDAGHGADGMPFDRWQSAKGLAVAVALVGVFLATDWPRDVAALVGAGVLLLSRRFASSRVMGLVDWELLVLFMGLFVVNGALAHSGVVAQAVAALRAQGWHFGDPATLVASTLLLSNLVSNVPAVMLLLPATDGGTWAGTALALVSTLAGNLLLVGSIANLIVADAARRAGVVIDWRRHARTGVPVTLITLAIALGWLAWRYP